MKGQMKDEAMEAHVKRRGIQIQQVIVIALKCKMVVRCLFKF